MFFFINNNRYVKLLQQIKNPSNIFYYFTSASYKISKLYLFYIISYGKTLYTPNVLIFSLVFGYVLSL